MKKKIKSKALLSLGVIATLATTGSVVLSCSSSDQQKLNEITTDMITKVIKAKLNPDSTTPAPNAPIDNKFTVTINGLDGVDIHVSNWQKVSLGFVLFSITSIDKGTAHVDGNKFGTIQISGFQFIPKFNQISGVNSSQISCIIQAQNNKYFIGTYNGLWVSTDSSGTSFAQVNNGIQPTWNIVSLCKTSNGHIYVGTNEHGLWISKYDGTTFTQVTGGLAPNNTITSIYQASNGSIFVGTYMGLWKSIDEINFSKQGGATLANKSIITICQISNGQIYVGTVPEGFWVSADIGTTFTRVSGDLGGYSVLSMHQTLNGQIFASAQRHGLWFSTDSGTSFNPVKDVLNDSIIYSIYQTSNEDIFLGCDFLGLWVSTDNGATFTQVSDAGIQSHWTIQSIYQSSDNTKLFIGTTDNGLWVSQ